MIESATGLIIRTRPLTETSLIVHWLTPEFGRLATVAKGARRPKSPFAGKLDLFYAAKLSFQRSRHSDLHNLREVVLHELHPELRRDLSYVQQAAYATSLIELTTETEFPLPEIHALLCAFLPHLPAQAPLPHSVFAFELKLLQELGLEPDLEAGPLPPDLKQLLRVLLTSDWPLLARLKLSPPQINGLSAYLRGFLAEHLGKVPAGRSAALRLD